VITERERERERERVVIITSIKPHNQGFGQGIMDSLGKPVKERSASNLINSDIAWELLEGDLGLPRKLQYPVSFFFFICTNQPNKQNKDHGNKDLSFRHDHGPIKEEEKAKKEKKDVFLPSCCVVSTAVCVTEEGLNRRERMGFFFFFFLSLWIECHHVMTVIGAPLTNLLDWATHIIKRNF